MANIIKGNPDGEADLVWDTLWTGRDEPEQRHRAVALCYGGGSAMSLG